ncbi:MAG: hypothetical protein B9S33_15595 [Pedosphaera sp. Tous-C6FEB]|nr:MAG: hypothetical protein B9S33_15595 [Pedosphaera sp. Tous-C6FEB]
MAAQQKQTARSVSKPRSLPETPAAPPITAPVYRFAGGTRLKLEPWPAAPASARVSVIIPVLNESARIASVVAFARKSPLVAEVIVVDDGSIDGTPELAHEAGAKVITSTLLGKGASMEDGLLAAEHEILLYLDGDLTGLSRELVAQLSKPIAEGRADFVKARFSRKAGRVTELTARPLMRTYFPELAHFVQPLGGIIAARKSLLRQLPFENDYGVDIGLFLDAAAAGARLEEVDIGRISHKSHPLEYLGQMATQVARAMIERAMQYGRVRRTFVRRVRETERHHHAHPERTLSRLGPVERLALFDMDGTLLDGRFIVELARRTERSEQLAQYLDRYDLTPEQRTRRIAALFKGVPKSVFERTVREMPLVPGAVETIVGLRKLGYRVGIVTDSYHVAAETIRRRVFADFTVANLMRFDNDRASGRVTLAPLMSPRLRTGHRAYDKLHVLKYLMRQMGLKRSQVLAVGDGLNDIGMLRAAGISVAFQPKHERVSKAAKRTLQGRLDELLQFLP